MDHQDRLRAGGLATPVDCGGGTLESTLRQQSGCVMPGPALPDIERFSPAAHVVDQMKGCKLSLAARLLALVLALKLRKTRDGKYVVWRGRTSLAALTGLSTKSITKARRELLEAGIFCHVVGTRRVDAANGKQYEVAKGVKVLELVRDVPAFLQARLRAREAAAESVETTTWVNRLEVQKRYLREEISDEQRIEIENSIRQQAEMDRRKACRREVPSLK